MKQPPVENFVIFVALLLLYVQTSAQHYLVADGVGGGRLKGRVLWADVGKPSCKLSEVGIDTGYLTVSFPYYIFTFQNSSGIDPFLIFS